MAAIEAAEARLGRAGNDAEQTLSIAGELSQCLPLLNDDQAALRERVATKALGVLRDAVRHKKLTSEQLINKKLLTPLRTFPAFEQLSREAKAAEAALKDGGP